MIRVGDLSRFTALPAGEFASFPADRPRAVRLTVNAPQRTVLNVVPITVEGEVPEDAEPVFLAVVDGLEEIEFSVLGPYALYAEADRVWLFTRDGETIHTVVPDAQTFTRIADRRVRDPNIEAMEMRLFQANEMRMAQAIREMRLEFAEQYQERPDDQGTGAPGGDSPAPEPANGSGQSASGSAAAGVGTEGGELDAASPGNS